MVMVEPANFASASSQNSEVFLPLKLDQCNKWIIKIDSNMKLYSYPSLVLVLTWPDVTSAEKKENKVIIFKDFFL